MAKDENAAAHAARTALGVGLLAVLTTGCWGSELDFGGEDGPCGEWALVSSETVRVDGEPVREALSGCMLVSPHVGGGGEGGAWDAEGISEAEAVQKYFESDSEEMSVFYKLSSFEGVVLFEDVFDCEFAAAGEPREVSLSFSDGSVYEATFSVAEDCEP